MKVQTGDLKWKEVFLKPAGDTLPVGSITEFGGSIIPKNWLKCDGSLISRATYPQLFKVIGTTYGEGDGSTTFNLPTMESENAIVIIKAKNSLGAAANVIETAESDYYDDVPNAKAVRDYVKEHGLIVSPTEPTTGEEVWIKKSDNLFNKNDLTENYYLDYINGVPTWDSNMAYMNSYIPVEPNTEYTMSANTGTIFVIHEYDEAKNFIGYKSQNTGATSYTMTTEGTTKYVRLSLGKSMKDVMQFQQGPATEYEEYIDKEIYVKNDNGVYELFDKVQTEKGFISAGLSEAPTFGVTPDTQNVLPNVIYEKRTNKFSLENGTFVINDGPHLVNVSVIATKWNTESIQLFIIHTRGSAITYKARGALYGAGTNYFDTNFFVEKGDIISFWIYNNEGVTQLVPEEAFTKFQITEL